MMNKTEYIRELDSLHAPDQLRQKVLALKKPRFSLKQATAIAAAAASFAVVLSGAWFLSNIRMGASSSGTGGEDVFQSYAGPILPLSIAGREVSAGRQLSMKVTSGSYMQVEDTYLFTGDAGTVTIALPVVSSLDDLSGLDAGLYLNGEALDYDVVIGGLLCGDRYPEYADYHDSLTEEYLSEALNGLQADLPETVTRYIFADLSEPSDEDNLQYGLTGTLQEGGRLLTYGFSGGRVDTGEFSADVRVSGSLRYEREAEVLVTGELANAALAGWTDGSCETVDPGFSGRLLISEEDAADTFLRLAADFWERYGGVSDDEDGTARALYPSACLEELALRLDTAADHILVLEDIFVEALHQDRVFYLTAEIELSAGDEITASYRKSPSRNYGGGGADTSLYGYDLLNAVENAVNVTELSAELTLGEGFELYQEDLGLVFTGERYEAVLDPAVERYTLILREKD